MFVRNPFLLWEYCIPRQIDALLGFIASVASLRSGLEPPLDGSSAHDLSFGTLLARFRSGSSASSLRCAWHLSLSRAPATLAFLAFLEP